VSTNPGAELQARADVVAWNPVTKRSPILGYNHNVRYRGLVFHVQTEDSGVLSPHLFTHLFHEGVIVSTRKLVYDAGAAEDAIKALMQAQHKAVMKDLKNAVFDEKIDVYLGGTPGLEPAKGSTAPVPKIAAPELTPTIRQERAETDVDSTSPVVMARAKSDDALTTPIALEISSDPNDLSSPIELPRKAEEPPIELEQLAKPRTKTAERGSKGSVRFNQPPALPPLPSDDLDPPTLTDDSTALAAAVAAANQAPQPQISRTVTPAPGLGVKFRTVTPPATPQRAATPPPIPQKRSLDSSSAEISLSLDDSESERNRLARDPTVELQAGDIRPPTRNRPPSHGAATLPPAKKPSRPAISPPSVVSRPITSSEDKSGAVEIHAAAPPSAEPPPGERSERPGQYSMNRRASDAPMRESTGRIAALTPGAVPVVPNRAKVPSEKPAGTRPAVATPVAGSAIPQAIGNDPSSGDPRVARGPNVTAPITNRNPQPPPNSGVVMTRPAVIVGAPQKPAQPQPPRVRMAREDEGRGFGQGLISEKSLDEVILAYLSEDGDDK
jgi:hypothetical protein